jgi:hypothetical protein
MSESSREETEPAHNNTDMASVQPTLPFFPPFVPDSDPASTGACWTKWVKRFENFLTAMTSLHWWSTLWYFRYPTRDGSESEDHTTALAKLSGYFTLKKNIVYEVYVFQQEKQHTGETLDQYATCKWYGQYLWIYRPKQSQIILSCLSSCLRRRALRESDSEDSSSDDEYIFLLRNLKTRAVKSKGKSPKVHVKNRSMPTEIIIDTGASVDIIDEHALLRIQKYLCKRNQPPIPTCKTNTSIRLRRENIFAHYWKIWCRNRIVDSHCCDHNIRHARDMWFVA